MKIHLLVTFFFASYLSFGQVRELADPKVDPSQINSKTCQHHFSFFDPSFRLSKINPQRG